MREAISTSDAPAAIGPYSQAIRAGDFLFVSGQIPLDPASGQLVAGGITDQTHRVLKNLDALLRAAGASFSHVVKTTVYLADMAEFADDECDLREYFPAPAPARRDHPGRAAAAGCEGRDRSRRRTSGADSVPCIPGIGFPECDALDRAFDRQHAFNPLDRLHHALEMLHVR